MKSERYLNISSVFLMMTVVFPLVSYAAPENFSELVALIISVLTAVLPLIVSLALLYFLWGLTLYLKNAGDKQEDARMMMFHGIIGFFVMSSVWGLVGILSVTFGTSLQKPAGVPDLYLNGSAVKIELQNNTNTVKDSVDSVNIKNDVKTETSRIKAWIKSFTSLFGDAVEGEYIDSWRTDKPTGSTGLDTNEFFDKDSSSYFEGNDLSNPYYYSGTGSDSDSTQNNPYYVEAAKEKAGGSFIFYLLPWNWF
ncbi:MAG: hypothetical protein V1851_02810 [Patescibacteria group bacterium]